MFGELEGPDIPVSGTVRPEGRREAVGCGLIRVVGVCRRTRSCVRRQLALEILDELAGTGLRPAVLVADTGDGANADFRHGLEDRKVAYVLQMKGEMTAHGSDVVPYQPAYGGLGPRPLLRHRTRPVSLREHVLAARRARGRTVTWRKGSKGAMSSHFVLLRVRLAGRRPKPAADGTIGPVWLIGQWPEAEAEPVKYWIANLPATIPAKDLVRLAK